MVKAEQRSESITRRGTEDLTEDRLGKVRGLEAIARTRNQTLPQMALSWVLRHPIVTTALIGASTAAQLEENMGAVEKANFTQEEDTRIGAVLKDEPRVRA